MGKQIQTICHYCEGEKYHDVLFVKRVKVTDDDMEDEFIAYMTLECAGCKMISFLTRKKDPLAIDDDIPYIDKNFFHDMGNRDFNFLRDKDYDMLPAKIQDLYDEVVISFNVEIKVMAGIGLRTLVEGVCIHQQIPGRNLQEKINQLHANGMISAAELPILDKLRLIGNQSTHRIKTFSLEKLSYALDIINHVLISIYILPKINRRLKI